MRDEMLEELHDLRAAAAAIRRINRKALPNEDIETIDRLLHIIDENGEAMARAIRIQRSTCRAVEAAKAGNEADQTFGIRRAIVSLVKLARLTGLSQLAKYEAVTRAADVLGIEPVTPFTHEPGSPEDKEENIDLHETSDGRAFLVEIIAQHLSLFPFGVVEHEAVKMQLVAMELAAQGRTLWPQPITRERVSPASGLQHLMETHLALRVGQSQAIAEHFGQKISVQTSLELAMTEYAEQNGSRITEIVSIPALLQRIQKDRDAVGRAFRFGKKRAVTYWRKNPELPDEMRKDIEKMR